MWGLRSASPGVAGRLGLPVLPFWRESHLLDTRQQYSIEVVAHFDENEFASLAVLTVEVDDGVARGAGAAKKVENVGTLVKPSREDGITNSVY